MATLTIADLDNGKRDLETVDTVANSRADTTTTRYGDSVLTLAGALRRLGWQTPVPYASGLAVTSGVMTVERDGVVYRPDPALVPFTTGAWNPDQWRVVQNTEDSGLVYQFPALEGAQAAAATLPEGASIVVEGESQGHVAAGEYVADSGTPAVRLQDYAALGAYSGKAQAADLVAAGISGRFYRRGAAAANGGTVIKDALGRSWERNVSGEIQLSWFGAKPDGTDCSVPLRNARTAANGGVIRAGSGVWKFDSVVSSSEDLNLVGEGDQTVLDFTGIIEGGSYGLEAIGSLSPIPGLSVDALKGSYSLTVLPGSQLKKGDIFVIYNPTTHSWSGFRSYYHAGEFCEVVSVAGNTVTLSNPLYDDYTSSAVELYLLGGPKVVLRDFYLKGTTIAGLVNIDMCIRPLVENVRVDNSAGSAVVFSRCFRPTYLRPCIHNAGSDGDDYGVVVANSQHSRIYGGNIFARRHAVAHGGSSVIGAVPVRDSRVIGAELKNDPTSGIFCADFHGNTEDSRYINCKIFGGASLQGKDNFYDDCAIHADARGIAMYHAEVKGGTLGARRCNFVVRNDPSLVTRGIYDIGGNNVPVSELTSEKVTFLVEDCELNGSNLSTITSFVLFVNRGASVTTNVVIDGLRGSVNTIGQLLYTNLVNGVAASEMIVVDNVTGFPAGVLLHLSNDGVYASFPHRCQQQSGNISVATRLASVSYGAAVNFRYKYPRVPNIQAMCTGDAAAGNRMPIAGASISDGNSFTPILFTGDGVSFTATVTRTVSWNSSLREV